MAALQLTSSTLSVRLTRGEKVAGLLREVTVPLSAVRSVEAVADGVAAVRGVRAPGLALPGRRIGTWRRRGERALVCVRRGQPALRMALEGQRYDTLLVGADDAAALAATLASRVG